MQWLLTLSYLTFSFDIWLPLSAKPLTFINNFPPNIRLRPWPQPLRPLPRALRSPRALGWPRLPWPVIPLLQPAAVAVLLLLLLSLFSPLSSSGFWCSRAKLGLAESLRNIIWESLDPPFIKPHPMLKRTSDTAVFSWNFDSKKFCDHHPFR